MKRASTPPQPGEQFGRWTVTGNSVMQGTRRLVPCRCECGTERLVMVQSLRRKDRSTPSCGCWRRERAATIVSETRWRGSHGLSGHPLYRLWKRIRRRCYDPAVHNYRWYGARGIGVCPEWRDDAGAFIAYIERVLGPRPPGMSLDRIDNDGDYAPGNVRWATPTEQVRNSRPYLERHGASGDQQAQVPRLSRDGCRSHPATIRDARYPEPPAPGSGVPPVAVEPGVLGQLRH